MFHFDQNLLLSWEITRPNLNLRTFYVTELNSDLVVLSHFLYLLRHNCKQASSTFKHNVSIRVWKCFHQEPKVSRIFANKTAIRQHRDLQQAICKIVNNAHCTLMPELKKPRARAKEHGPQTQTQRQSSGTEEGCLN